ncbi:hypothetical protein BS614_20150 [Paenibacillus xylanexedens]|uniref:DMT family transporter n=1 Tax=Paenibacillus xylanexedens TaxID=528191 RepID=UPI000938281A|nr:DMT family transporter [Paenibacillus xylanexedens]APO46110.1 hypothetical protein BS614_20150 [Paenibacillus xylanexedens]
MLNHTSLVEYNSSDWIYFFLLVLIPTIFGQYLINLLLKSLGATTVSVGIIGEPILAIILAYAFLGESISGFQFIGGMMTILGMGGIFGQNHGAITLLMIKSNWLVMNWAVKSKSKRGECLHGNY